MSLRWRLTLHYSLVSVLILLAGALTAFLGLRSSLRLGLDNSLREATALAASQLGGDEAAPHLAETGSDRLQTRLPGATVLLVYRPDGRLVDRLGTPRRPVPLVAGYADVGNERAFTVRLPEGGWVQAIRSKVEVLDALGRFEQLLLLALPSLALVGLAAGYLLADRALRPLDAVSSLAGSIAASGSYQGRVPQAPGSDEMARLTRTVNAMLARLEETIDRERAFALAAAHELRTPITVLRGRAGLSLRRERSLEQYRQALETVEATAAEMADLVDSLLALARTNQPPARLEVDLAALAVEVVDAMNPLAATRSVRLHLDPAPVTAHGDPAALRLATSNLVRNAIEHGRAGGEVWVRSLRRGGDAIVEVADDGPGVSPADLGRLRQPFQRGRGSRGASGAGLGLALVEAVAEQHGGRLELSRAAEGGLLGRLRLPDSTAAAPLAGGFR